MYTEDVVRVALAGEGSDGFLISYPRELGAVVKSESGKDESKDSPISVGSDQVTRFAPSAEAAAKVIAAILTKAAKDAQEEHPKDAFDRAFAKAAKEV